MLNLNVYFVPDESFSPTLIIHPLSPFFHYLISINQELMSPALIYSDLIFSQCIV